MSQKTPKDEPSSVVHTRRNMTSERRGVPCPHIYSSRGLSCGLWAAFLRLMPPYKPLKYHSQLRFVDEVSYFGSLGFLVCFRLRIVFCLGLWLDVQEMVAVVSNKLSNTDTRLDGME